MSNKNIYLILGATSDLGIGLLTELNRKKSQSIFLCHYHNPGHLGLIQPIISENNNIFQYFQADFTVITDVYNMIHTIKEKWGAPTHIVHFPAGKFHYERLKEFQWETFCQEMEIQVHGFLEILKVFLPCMTKGEAKGKLVIMLSSSTLSNPPKYMLGYMMAKYALLGLMKSLASDYAGKNICINGISPSMIETKFWNETDYRLKEQNALKSVEKRNGIVSDIVPAILFLLSEDSDFIHGVNLNVSNGNWL